jgi:hypothetical protein
MCPDECLAWNKCIINIGWHNRNISLWFKAKTKGTDEER